MAVAPESTTPALNFVNGTVDTCGNFPLVSLIPVEHLDLRISRIFEKIRNDPNIIFRGFLEDD
jgi:hypothetical protein